MLRDELRGRAQLSRRLIVEYVISRLKKSNASPVWCVGKHAGSLSSPENLRIWQMWVRQKKREKKSNRDRERDTSLWIMGKS
jgi:hypothetical protein